MMLVFGVFINNVNVLFLSNSQPIQFLYCCTIGVYQ